MRMDMTAPVSQAAVAGGMRVQFVLPKGVTLATAPEPIDPRVQLRLVPATTWAVIRYSGTWSQSNYREHLEALKAALQAAGVATQGEPVLARYNPPFTPWFMRRNEIWLALR
jgi:nucleotide-binding universal stress UspA family protein